MDMYAYAHGVYEWLAIWQLQVKERVENIAGDLGHSKYIIHKGKLTALMMGGYRKSYYCVS